MDAFNKFNQEVHFKRKEITLKVANVKELKTDLSSEAFEYDAEEFKKFGPETQA
jgi:hypothetical protein